MNIKQLKNSAELRVFKYINERRGWKTNRKIIVIESDDWGSIRMPNKEIYEKCLRQGFRVDKSHYNKYDSLASKQDLEHLYSILIQYRDKNNNPPVITANTLVANPDFERIKEDNFSKYYYERFTDTINRYDNCSLATWNEGINNKLFFPQLHGREHLNIARWMQHLKSPSNEMMFVFNNNLIGLGPKITNNKLPSFVQAFDQKYYLKDHSIKQILTDAVRIFEDVFGYKSKSFIAPNYIWNDKIEEILASLHVEYFQCGLVHNKPCSNKKQYHYLGQKNNFNQLYLTRNVTYEPSSDLNKDWNSLALKQIRNAFKLNKPAIICMHRVNFIGSIFEGNRVNNLKLFNQLLRQIIKTWPEVEFMNSAQLGDLIEINSNLENTLKF